MTDENCFIHLIDRGLRNEIVKKTNEVNSVSGKCVKCVVEEVENTKILKQDNLKYNANIEISAIFAATEITVGEEIIAAGLREEKIITETEFAIPDVGNDILMAGRMHPKDLVVNGKYKICCGSAHLASQSYNERDQINNEIHDFIPPPSLANPMPNGGTYTPADFTFETDSLPKQTNRFATSIARQINTLHPLVRCKYANGIISYLEQEFKRKNVGERCDINISEGYRSPERSNQLRASGIRAAPAGHSWHNYGLAADFTVYTQRNGSQQWHYDDGRRGDSEYTGRLRPYLERYGLINDLSGDSGHFYVKAFGKGVPLELRTKEISVPELFYRKGVPECEDGMYDIVDEDAEENEKDAELATLEEMKNEIEEAIMHLTSPEAYHLMNSTLADNLNSTNADQLKKIYGEP